MKVTGFRDIMVRWFGILLIGVPLSGCAANGGISSLFTASADDEVVNIEGCLNSITASLVTEIDSLNYVIQDCLGEAFTHDAKMIRSHVTVLLLANYGVRVIGTVKAIDEDAAAQQALVLKHRIQKAMTELNSIRNPGTLTSQEWEIRQTFPNYRKLAVRQAGDVQLFGVARAAFSPLAWRARETLRTYLKGAAGGFSGLLRTAIDRRKIGAAKLKNATQTVTLGKAALFDSRCLLAAVDFQLLSVGKSPADTAALLTELSDNVNDILSDAEKAKGALKCDASSYPTNLHILAWNSTDAWRKETEEALAALADPS